MQRATSGRGTQTAVSKVSTIKLGLLDLVTQQELEDAAEWENSRG